MRVDIICRTKDRPRLLARALDSILVQEHREWHVVLVNDGGDRAAIDDVIEPRREGIAGRMARIDNERSRNRAAALNQGLEAAAGPLVAFLDDDDTWAPEFLSQGLARYTSFPHFPLGGTACSTMKVEEIADGDRYTTVKEEIFLQHPDGLLSLPEMLLGNQVTTNALLLSLDAVSSVGGCDETLPVLEDWEMLVRLLAKHDIRTSPACLARYHMRRVGPSDPAGNSPAEIDHEVYRELIYNRWLRSAGSGGDMLMGLVAAHARLMRAMLDGQRHAILEQSCSLRALKNKIGRLFSRK